MRVELAGGDGYYFRVPLKGLCENHPVAILMRCLFLIAIRECSSLFATPTAWALATLYQLLAGILFTFGLETGRYADLAPLYLRLTSLLLVIIPVISMGRIAGERRQGTMELLLTSPAAAWQIVGGKFLGLAAFVVLLTILTLQYPLILMAYANPDPGQWIPATVGFALVGCLLAAIGLFASSVTENQAFAGILAVSLSLVLWWAQGLSLVLESQGTGLYDKVSLLHRFAGFNQGIIDSRDLFYFVALIGFFLSLASRGVESDRW